ncbi:MAG: hypothetical protein KDB03_17150 [Planctomycetales bacterium]|nr:hypothetical protein [Planctomycetales bacterium]
MQVNPYHSTITERDDKLVAIASRVRAQKCLRAVLLLLLIPAIYNYVEFDMEAIGSQQLPGFVPHLFRSVNILGMVVGTLLIWKVGLRILEIFALGIRTFVGRRIEFTAWMDVFYGSITNAVWLAVPG